MEATHLHGLRSRVAEEAITLFVAYRFFLLFTIIYFYLIFLMPEIDLFLFSTPERIATYNKLLITRVATTS